MTRATPTSEFKSVTRWKVEIAGGSMSPSDSLTAGQKIMRIQPCDERKGTRRTAFDESAPCERGRGVLVSLSEVHELERLLNTGNRQADGLGARSFERDTGVEEDLLRSLLTVLGRDGDEVAEELGVAFEGRKKVDRREGAGVERDAVDEELLTEGGRGGLDWGGGPDVGCDEGEGSSDGGESGEFVLVRLRLLDVGDRAGGEVCRGGE